MSISYSYDGTFDGFLTSVFMAYSRRENPVEIMERGCLQEVFGRESFDIETDEALAKRVEAGIISKMGSPCHNKIWTVFLSGETEKATRLYRYIRRGFEIGRGIYNNISHPDVVPIEKLYVNVWHESHLFTGFARFSEMEGGVFYSKITPKNSVVPLIMPHFTERLSVQPFLLHDASHGIVGVYNLKSWQLVETSSTAILKPAANELEYRRMWKNFYDTVAIAERIKPPSRRGSMAMRFWPNMTELSYIPPKDVAKSPVKNTPIVPIN